MPQALASTLTLALELGLRLGFLLAAWRGSRDPASRPQRAEAVFSHWTPSILRAPVPGQVPGSGGMEACTASLCLRVSTQPATHS